MAANIKIKRSAVAGNPASLGAGELAYSSLADNGSNGGDRLYIGTGSETGGNAANHEVIGGKFFTDMVTAATNLNTISTLVKRDSSGNFSAGIITANLVGSASTAGSATTAGTVTTAAQPNITSVGTLSSLTVSGVITGAQVGNVIPFYYGSQASFPAAGSYHGAIAHSHSDGKMYFAHGGAWNALANASDLSITASGDATGTSSGSALALTLATVNSNVGTFGSTTAIPVVTVNAKGLVTAVTTAAISSSLSIAGTTGTDTVAVGTDTLTFAGGTGVTTAVTNNQVSFAIGQAVGVTDNVTFNNVTVNGTLTSDDITSASISVSGNATITGNLTVQGTTTTINSTAVAVSDLNITLAKDATTAAAANGAGLTVAGPTVPATILYVSSDDSWTFNKDIRTSGTIYGNITGTITGVASSANKWETARNLSLTGDATATLTAVDGTAAVSAALTLATVNTNVGTFNNVTVNAKGLVTAASTVAYLTANETITASGDATGSGTTSLALTLATVNSTVGSFGTATSVPAVTVNAKGLVTSVTTNTIPTATTSVLGLASFDTADFIVTAGAVTIKAIDGGTY